MSSKSDEIKDKVDIVDVVSQYVELKQAGVSVKARCPFHNEKTPSFTVSRERQTYHCFGCGRGGDIFSFVQEMEGVDFVGALKILADKAGVTLDEKYTPQGGGSNSKRLYAALEDATKFYERALRVYAPVVEYLKNRHVMGETARDFRLGYAPAEWRALYTVLRKKGHAEKDMLDAGLIIQSEKGYYDRFRNRVMFPISDPSGRVIGFSGRIMPNADTDTAKYVNSPETKLFDKSKVLYGLDKARLEIRSKDACVFVEGQMDLIMSHQAKVTHVVAASGTALTTEHFTRMRRIAGTAIFAFDADEAGMNAALRSVELAIEAGLEVRIIPLPDGSDPADVIAESSEVWTEMIAGALPALDVILEWVPAGDDKRALVFVEEKVYPLVARLSSHIERARAVSKLASHLQVDEVTIMRDLSRVISKRNQNSTKASTPSNQQKPTKKTEVSRKALIERTLIGIVWSLQSRSEADDECQRHVKTICVLGGKQDDCKLTDLYSEEELNSFATYAENMYEGTETMLADLEELIVRLQCESLKDERRIKTRVLSKGTESTGVDNDSLLKEVNELTKQISALEEKI